MLFIVFSSYITYEKIIRIKKNIIPDLSTIANEIWVIIAIFLFQIVNKVSLPNEGTIKRKNSYLYNRYTDFQGKYGSFIKEKLNDPRLEALTYAIMVYEDFNRPKAVRILENIMVRLTNKPYTLGVMQVKSLTPLSDRKSVELGVMKILTDYQVALISHQDRDETFRSVLAYEDVIKNYNGGSKYLEEIQRLHEAILEGFYKIDKYNDSV